MAIEPGVPCSCNKHTREGRYNLDPDIKFFATPPHHGSLAQVSSPRCATFDGGSRTSASFTHMIADHRRSATPYTAPAVVAQSCIAHSSLPKLLVVGDTLSYG